MAFKNEVSFSPSSKKLLERCARQYWYGKYAYWNGWWYGNRPPVSKTAEEAYTAKHMDTVYSWTGSIVHEVAARTLKAAQTGRPWHRGNLETAMLKEANARITKGLKQARTQKSGNPKKRLQLVEEEFGIAYDERWLRNRVDSRIRSLMSDDDKWNGPGNVNLFLHALSRADRIVSVEDLFNHIHHATSVYLSIDLMMRSAHDPEHDCVIVDWKTGIPRDEDVLQVGQYGLWARKKQWQNITLLLIYLNEEGVEVRSVVAGESTIAAADEEINIFTDKLATMLVNGDLKKNVPIESKFEPTSDPGNCMRCAFQGMCERDGTKP